MPNSNELNSDERTQFFNEMRDKYEADFVGKLCKAFSQTFGQDNAISETKAKSQAWNAISKEFAAQAEGDVHVFLPKDIGALTIFWNVELPELCKQMQPFMNPPKVRDITLHSPNDQTLINLKQIEQNQTLTETQRKEEKRKFMKNQTNWDSKKIKDASIEVPGMTQAQKEQIKQVIENSPNPRQMGLVEILNSINTDVNSITLNKLHNIGERWRINVLVKAT